MTSNRDNFRLPPPVFAFPEKHPSGQSVSQQNNFTQSSGYSVINHHKPGFSQNINPWMNWNAPGQSSLQERYAKPHKPKFHKPRNVYNAYKPKGRGSSSFYCDSCDRGFSAQEEYQYHCNNEHITCGLDGCTLSAHPKVVEKHQKIQHLSGLYLRLMSNSSKNPEDVAKWIAERKKNYPTKANVERRKEVEKERLERGETLEPEKRRFGRFGGRVQQQGSRGGRGGRNSGRDRKPFKNNLQFKEGHVPRSIRGRGRGGSWKSSERISHQKVEKVPEKEMVVLELEDKKSIPMFCGTAKLFGTPLEEEKSSEEEIERDEGDFSDSEWLMDDSAVKCENNDDDEKSGETSLNSSNIEKNTVVLNNSLGLLIGTYGSDDSDSDEESKDDKPPPKKVFIKDKSDSEQKPTVVKTLPSVAENQSEGKSLDSNTLSDGRGNVEHDSDDSGPEVECIKKGPIDSVVSSGKVVDEVKVKVENDSEVFNQKKMNDGVKMEVEDQSQSKEKEVKNEDESRKRSRRGRRRNRRKGERDTEDGRKRIKEENETGKADEDEDKAAKQRKQMEMKQNQRYPTLLEELLKDEIRRERNAILQCIRYVVENNFFDKVETSTSKEVSEEKLVIKQEPSWSGYDCSDEPNSVTDESNKDVEMSDSVEVKHNASPNGGEIVEPTSCRSIVKEENDVDVEKRDNIKSSCSESESKVDANLESQTDIKLFKQELVNESQVGPDVPENDLSHTMEIDVKISESSQEINKDSKENSNNAESSHSVCHNAGIIPEEKCDKDSLSTTPYDTSISTEVDERKPEISSLKGNEC